MIHRCSVCTTEYGSKGPCPTCNTEYDPQLDDVQSEFSEDIKTAEVSAADPYSATLFAPNGLTDRSRQALDDEHPMPLDTLLSQVSEPVEDDSSMLMDTLDDEDMLSLELFAQEEEIEELRLDDALPAPQARSNGKAPLNGKNGAAKHEVLTPLEYSPPQEKILSGTVPADPEEYAPAPAVADEDAFSASERSLHDELDKVEEQVDYEVEVEALAEGGTETKLFSISAEDDAEPVNSTPQDSGDSPPYFKLLALDKEPFSNSPDPDLFYPEPQQVETLRKLEIAVRLKRGLNVVLGDVGTGKTTLFRQLHRNLNSDETFALHTIHEPLYSSRREFIRALFTHFDLTYPGPSATEKELIELLKGRLYDLAVGSKKTVVLLIDEGQLLVEHCLETLRLLLNYETGESKLLQIVIFAQTEFEPVLMMRSNLADRISELCVLKSFDRRSMSEMIHYRLDRSSGARRAPAVFSGAAMLLMYFLTRGFPRKVVSLCHRVVLNLLAQEKEIAGWRMVMKSAGKTHVAKPISWQLVMVLLVFVCAGGLFLWRGGEVDSKELAAPSSVAYTAAASAEATMNDDEAAANELTAEKVVTPSSMKSQPAEQVKEEAKTAEKDAPTTEKSVEQAAEKIEPAQPAAVAETTTAPAKGVKSMQQESAAVATAPVYSDPPKDLGVLKVESGDQLSVIIRNVYGSYGRNTLNLVLDANKQLSKPDDLRPGQRLKFPAVPIAKSDFAPAETWVKLGQESKLDTAYDRLRNIKKKEKQVMLLPHWDPQNGLVFGLYLKKGSNGEFNEPSALELLHELPKDLQSKGEFITQRDPQTIYFGFKRPSPNPES